MESNKIILVAAFAFLGLMAAGLLVSKGLTPKSGLRTRGQKASTTDESLPEAARILYAQLDHLHRQGGQSDIGPKEFALYLSLGQIYQEAGNFPESIKLFIKARDSAVQRGESENIVKAQTMLGIAYDKAGRRQEAKRELEGAFLLLDRRGPNAFTTLRALGNVRRDSGKFDEALALYSQAQQPQQEPQWERSSHTPPTATVPVDDMAVLLRDMGMTHHARGQLDEAMKLYKQSLDKQVGLSGKVGQQTGATLELVATYNAMGRSLHDKGELEHAEEYYFKALRLQQKIFRTNHPSIVETLVNIAQAQRDSGSALEVPLATLERAETMVQGQGADFSDVKSLKADILREKGDLEEAERHAREALAAQMSILGSEDMPETAVFLNGLGSVLHDKENFQGAVDEYMKALDINLKSVGTMHPETAATYNNIGNAYQDVGQNEEAVRYYKQCLEIQKKVFGDANPDLAVSYNNIGTVLVRQEKYAEAEGFVVKAVEVVKAAGMPPGSPSRSIYEENLAVIRDHLSGPKPAEEQAETEVVKEQA